MKKILTSGIILTFPYLAFANIVINEIAWMGSEDSSSKEWIELYNYGDKDISIEGWKLFISKTEILLSGVIKSNSYYLLERKDDNTIEEIEADLIYKKALNNKGEIITLLNNNNELIDQVNCSAGWFAGDNTKKTTMERVDWLIEGDIKENWQNSESMHGSPKEKNFIKEKPKARVDDSYNYSETKTNSYSIYLIGLIVSSFSSYAMLIIRKSLKY